MFDSGPLRALDAECDAKLAAFRLTGFHEMRTADEAPATFSANRSKAARASSRFRFRCERSYSAAMRPRW